MATYWENSCSFGLRYVSWYKYLIVSLVFSHLGFWSGNLFLIAPFPDLCLLVPFFGMARRTLYALIKTGVHGTNGLNPNVFYRIYQIYVIPRLLYSLEVLPLTETQIGQLQRSHISTLKRIQSLPERTAFSVVQLLLGALPVVAEIHKRQLSLLYSIVNSRNDRIKGLMARQLSLQHHKSFSREYSTDVQPTTIRPVGKSL